MIKPKADRRMDARGGGAAGARAPPPPPPRAARGGARVRPALRTALSTSYDGGAAVAAHTSSHMCYDGRPSRCRGGRTHRGLLYAATV
jgi:hypothetical protein